jgi:hypothetical protein
VGIAAESDTRRRARRSEIDTDSWAIAQLFAAQRLLVIQSESGSDDVTVEVAHEAIIRHWARLQGWTNEDRQALLVQQQLEDLTAEWLASERSEDSLIHGRRLRTLLTRVDRAFEALSAASRELLIRSAIADNYQLEHWVPRFAANGDAVTLARQYLLANNLAKQKTGLEILRLIPAGATVDAADWLLADAMARHDVEHQLFKRAVQASCERNEGRAVRVLREASPPQLAANPLTLPDEHGRVSDATLGFRADVATARARNHPRVGRTMLATVSPRRRPIIWLLSTYTLVADNLQAFVLVIAWVAVLSQFGSFVVPVDPALVPLTLLSVFRMVTLAVLALYVGLRSRTDRRPVGSEGMTGLAVLAAVFSEFAARWPDGGTRGGTAAFDRVLLTAPALVLVGRCMVREAVQPFATEINRLAETMGRDVGRTLRRASLAIVAAYAFNALIALMLARSPAASEAASWSARWLDSTFTLLLPGVDEDSHGFRAVLLAFLFFKDLAIGFMGLLGFKAAVTLAFEGRAAGAWLEARDASGPEAGR